MARYEVEYSARGTIEVEADSESEAEDAALDELFVDGADIEIDGVYEMDSDEDELGAEDVTEVTG